MKSAHANKNTHQTKSDDKKTISNISDNSYAKRFQRWRRSVRNSLYVITCNIAVFILNLHLKFSSPPRIFMGLILYRFASNPLVPPIVKQYYKTQKPLLYAAKYENNWYEIVRIEEEILTYAAHFRPTATQVSTQHNCDYHNQGFIWAWIDKISRVYKLETPRFVDRISITVIAEAAVQLKKNEPNIAAWRERYLPIIPGCENADQRTLFPAFRPLHQNRNYIPKVINKPFFSKGILQFSAERARPQEYLEYRVDCLKNFVVDCIKRDRTPPDIIYYGQSLEMEMYDLREMIQWWQFAPDACKERYSALLNQLNEIEEAVRQLRDRHKPF